LVNHALFIAVFLLVPLQDFTNILNLILLIALWGYVLYATIILGPVQNMVLIMVIYATGLQIILFLKIILEQMFLVLL